MELVGIDLDRRALALCSFAQTRLSLALRAISLTRCAPEVILNMKCSSSADMYSYGVLLWEICTGETPIRGRMRAPRIPEECPQEVADLIGGCLWSEMNLNDTNSERPWHKLNVARRPTASECFDMLSAMLLSVD